MHARTDMNLWGGMPPRKTRLLQSRSMHVNINVHDKRVLRHERVHVLVPHVHPVLFELGVVFKHQMPLVLGAGNVLVDVMVAQGTAHDPCSQSITMMLNIVSIEILKMIEWYRNSHV